jgi:tetratricopeptide (TPR) repeat protein
MAYTFREPSKPMRFSTLLLSLVVVTGSVVTSLADDGERARELFKKGQTEHVLGNFEKALPHYTEALRLLRKPNIMLNIAQCHRQLGAANKALYFYELYLTEYAKVHAGKASPYENEIRGHIAELRTKRDVKKPETPVTQPASQPAAQVTKENPATQPAKPRVVASSLPKPKSGHTPEKKPHARKRIWTWVAAGGAVVSLAAAIGVWVSAGNDRDSARGLLTNDPRWQSLQDQVEQKDLASNILGYGVASALAITSVVLFFVEGKGPADEKDASVRWQVTSTGDIGLGLRGQF